MMDEEKLRERIVEEAKSWIGTPYISNAMIKGKRGGTDCAMILKGVYGAAGIVPEEFDPRPYPAQWHVHRNEEVYMSIVHRFAREVPAPPEREPKAADVVMFKIGKVFAHAAIVIDWPTVIHAVGGACVVMDDISKNTTGKRALWTVPKHFFSPIVGV